LSNWEDESYSDDQKSYAATDAWVSYEIYKLLSESEGKFEIIRINHIFITMKISIEHALSFIDKDALTKFKVKAKEANKLLHTKEGKGSDYLGWVELPININKELLSDIDSLVHKLRNKIDFMVTIGIGGSYLGCKSGYRSFI
jgi:hypothetical protein